MRLRRALACAGHAFVASLPIAPGATHAADDPGTAWLCRGVLTDAPAATGCRPSSFARPPMPRIAGRRSAQDARIAPGIQLDRDREAAGVLARELDAAQARRATLLAGRSADGSLADASELHRLDIDLQSLRREIGRLGGATPHPPAGSTAPSTHRRTGGPP